MVKVALPYGEREITMEIPDANVMGIYSPREVETVECIKAEIARALSNPIGCPSLRELAHGKTKVVLIADDNTRLTPTHEIIPVMLDELNAGGVADRDISVVIALGTHRDMTEEEILVKFGQEVVNRVAVYNHNYKDPRHLVDLGKTENGTPIQINKRVYEADLAIGIGSIVPHHIPGFAGGAKIVQPGVSGEITTGATHLLSVKAPRSYLGVEDNPVRKELNHIARLVGVNYILNTVLDRYGKVVKAFFGDVEEAFVEGVQVSKGVYAVELPREADIVLSSSHPCNLEFWQAHKTLYPSDLAVKEGGIIIVVTPCPEGVAKTHGEMIEYTGLSPWEVRAMLEEGVIADPVAAALAVAWGQVKERARVFIVSDGISEMEARKLGFEPFSSVEAALAEALRREGPGAQVAVLTHAPDMLPLIKTPAVVAVE
ncbi:MAG: nickel-dependent lactate racemase [Bacillota bacterium]